MVSTKDLFLNFCSLVGTNNRVVQYGWMDNRKTTLYPFLKTAIHTQNISFCRNHGLSENKTMVNTFFTVLGKFKTQLWGTAYALNYFQVERGTQLTKLCISFKRIVCWKYCANNIVFYFPCLLTTPEAILKLYWYR